MKYLWIGLSTVSILLTLISTQLVNAAPIRDEVYRRTNPNIIVYRDEKDQNIFWYVPPIEILKENGAPKYFKRKVGNKTQFSFYVIATMNQELLSFLSREIPNLRRSTQLKPVQAKRFGIQVSQFETKAMSDDVSDYNYLNNPHLVQFKLTQDEASEFEFFLNSSPGIQANVLIEFASSKVDKYLDIELSFKEIYRAIGGGVNADIVMTKAEIEGSLMKYLTKKNINIKSKGDVQISDTFNKIIEECFIPLSRKAECRYPGDPQCEDDGGMNNGSEQDADGNPIKKVAKFKFNADLKNSNQTLRLSDIHYVDNSEVTEVPVYLSLKNKISNSIPETKESVSKRSYKINGSHTASNPLATKIQLQNGMQLVVTMNFQSTASTSYEANLELAKALFYRIGDGPWTRAIEAGKNLNDNRLLIQSDTIETGELEFYLDKSSIRKQNNPQFEIVITGRGYQF